MPCGQIEPYGFGMKRRGKSEQGEQEEQNREKGSDKVRQGEYHSLD